MLVGSALFWVMRFYHFRIKNLVFPYSIGVLETVDKVDVDLHVPGFLQV